MEKPFKQRNRKINFIVLFSQPRTKRFGGGVGKIRMSIIVHREPKNRLRFSF